MSIRRIQLKRYAPQQVMLANYGAYRLRVEVSAVEGPDLDTNIFIYRRSTSSPYTAAYCDRFEAVAGPPQLAAIPALEPDPDQEWPLYRLNYIELDLASTAQADEIWQEVQNQAQQLVEALNRLDTLSVTETVWYPTPPEQSSQFSTSL